ncbi:Non-specific serine/threonine protein kinase [Fusarium keratoplasticum]|uniref:Non-specific serine/threonine protein kinase n=1 Tax=Fusarium keratoplasticum TaxID=1328300 RepID=A0ACC0R8R2_9HYPO|nr:Non-specific serine/threonine protein kinase [Fusarium keratoplasticum]KAI8679802.1 Non-specific serine/threonine protein kinase [Fusarium keratoplasticum]KAI8685889.1 Non-specific serine/threonine protein kinase [Fusarium keratoplasticum]
MKLDTRAMRHLASEDWRVLTAVEMGSKNHELVPTPLIEKISRLRGGASGVHRSISALAKVGLIARVKEAKYDGYRLTYGGLDYLALHTHAKRKDVYSVGNRIGVGKESDIMVVADETGTQRVLKIHRLGRISFRTVKSNRDYLKNRQSGSWMYLSRLAAMKEFAFMKALREEGFPVPEPIAQSRHTIVMSLIDAFPLRQISDVPDPASLYADLISLILRLAKHGLIHGDFNEFNILVKEERTKSEDGQEVVNLEPIIIDFPQMVSMEHQNAEMYFDRDVNCIKRFFERRFHFVTTEPGPFFKNAKKTVGKDGVKRLDATVEASGFTKKMLKDLEAAIKDKAETKEQAADDEDEDDEDEEDEDEDEDEEGDGSSNSGGLLGEDAKNSPDESVEEGISKLTV